MTPPSPPSRSRKTAPRKPTIIGLTGSIGMGKSTVAAMLAELGLPVHDADQAVHAALAPGGAAYAKVAKLFPLASVQGHIDRRLLAQEVFGDEKKLRALEALLHPLVRRSERAFILKAKKAGSLGVVLEIPLLFETQAQDRVDVVVCVSAPLAVQQARALRRPGMTLAKLRSIRRRQMNERKKRQLADFVIDTHCSKRETKRQIEAMWQKLQQRRR